MRFTNSACRLHFQLHSALHLCARESLLRAHIGIYDPRGSDCKIEVVIAVGVAVTQESRAVQFRRGNWQR